MTRRAAQGALFGALSTVNGVFGMQDPAGSIRGTVYDADFDAPLALARVQLVELEAEVETSGQGSYVFGEVQPGQYTPVFSRGDDYVRQVRSDVVVSPASAAASRVRASLGAGEGHEEDRLEQGGEPNPNAR